MKQCIASDIRLKSIINGLVTVNVLYETEFDIDKLKDDWLLVDEVDVPTLSTSSSIFN